MTDSDIEHICGTMAEQGMLQEYCDPVTGELSWKMTDKGVNMVESMPFKKSKKRKVIV